MSYFYETEFKVWAGLGLVLGWSWAGLGLVLGQPTVHKFFVIVLKDPTFEGDFSCFHEQNKFEFLYMEASALKG